MRAIKSIVWLRREDSPQTLQMAFHSAAAAWSIVPLLSRHDLLFLPTAGENFGHVILEAMQAGVPVLISDKTLWKNLSKHHTQLGAFPSTIHGFRQQDKGGPSDGAGGVLANGRRVVRGVFAERYTNGETLFERTREVLLSLTSAADSRWRSHNQLLRFSAEYCVHTSSFAGNQRGTETSGDSFLDGSGRLKRLPGDHDQCIKPVLRLGNTLMPEEVSALRRNHAIIRTMTRQYAAGHTSRRSVRPRGNPAGIRSTAKKQNRFTSGQPFSAIAFEQHDRMMSRERLSEAAQDQEFVIFYVDLHEGDPVLGIQRAKKVVTDAHRRFAHCLVIFVDTRLESGIAKVAGYILRKRKLGRLVAQT